MAPILLVPARPVDRALLYSLRAPLNGAFQFTASPSHPNALIAEDEGIDGAPAFDHARKQYFSSTLLSAVNEKYSSHGGKILCVTSGDLFVPVLTYLFGEAQLQGKAAVVSTFRLDESFYGLPANDALTKERLLKESLHELGHTFGLFHCHDLRCVMHSSTAVEEIDLKGGTYCETCRERIVRAAGDRRSALSG